MNESSFVEKREPDWKRITFLCDKADMSPTSLTNDELNEFIRLYRNVSADLALVRTKSSNVPLVLFLNDMVGRAYGLLYRSKRNPILKALQDAVAGAAQTVRRRKWFIVTSASLVFGSALFLFLLFFLRPDIRAQYLGITTSTGAHFSARALSPTPGAPIAENGFGEVIKQWTDGKLPDRTSSESVAMWGMYASHNPLVAIISGSVAASTFGVGTVVMLIQNGQILGALSFEMMRVGKLGFLLASIFPHGVPEISGLIISGAAGLCMGWALINPGRKRRGEALLDAGKDAITLLATSVCMMFIAAPIEGFFSFNPNIPSWVKVVVIVVELIVWGLFWTGFGKSPEEQLEPA